ncbi:MAG: hypothetical protein CJBNEKGG_04317 [Prosthecobacter sp.]|nr:hypothetical protein [Prosthecobacter sp.]
MKGGDARAAAVPGVAPLRKGAASAQDAPQVGRPGADWVPVALNPFQERLIQGAAMIDRRRLESRGDEAARELRLWKTGFKYPMVREEVWLRPDKSGKLQPVRREFSVADHVMIRFPEGTSNQAAAAWAQKHGLQVRHQLKTAPVLLVAADQATLDTAGRIMSLFARDFPEAGSGVAERDYLVFPSLFPNDSEFPNLWGLHNTGQTGGLADADIDAPEAWDITTGSREVLVGVVDTGVDRTHPDLAANMWTHNGEVSGNGLDDDGNGFVDDVYGWDFYAMDNDPMDENNHGTHCSGTLGGVGNNLNGVAGVCWQVSIVGIRFLGPAGGTTSDAIESVNYATRLGVDLTSNSWGGGGFSSLLQSAIAAAGAAEQLFIAAAGNDGLDTDTTVNYPSGYALDNIVSVAASTALDARASFSNYGRQTVDLAAPGASIYSSILGGSYANFNGTSMATPHVSGAVALLKSIAPGLSALEVKTRLMESVDPVAAFATTTVSGGRLNVARLIQDAAGPFPVIQVTSVAEAPGGNADGINNPGELLNVHFTVVNRGTEEARNIRAEVAPATLPTAFTVVQGEVSVGTVAPGASVSSSAPLQIRSSVNVSTPHAEEMVLTLRHGTPEEVRSQRVTVYLHTSSRIEGRVTSAEDGSPIAGATVKLAGPSTYSAQTSASGDYSVLVTDGSYQATVSAPGYVPADPVQLSTPPGRSGLNFTLGIPQLVLTPPEVSVDVFSGRRQTQVLEMRNRGSAPLLWNLRLLDAERGFGVQALPLVKLPERAIPAGRECRDAGLRSFFKSSGSEAIASLEAPLGTLSGMTIGTVESPWDRAVLLADLEARGARIVEISLPLSAAGLAELDALLVDDAIGLFSNLDISLLRSRVTAGMGVLCEADDGSSVTRINELFAGTGITAVSTRFRDLTLTDIRPHPITAGVSRLVEVSVGAAAQVSGSAKVLVAESDGLVHAAVSRLGTGTLVFVGNEITDEFNFVSGDGRRFANQIVDGLLGGPEWLAATPLSGVLAPGMVQQLQMSFDPGDLEAGVYQAAAVFETNMPGEEELRMPVTMNLVNAPQISSTPANLDFGSVVEAVRSGRNVTVSNVGRERLVVSSVGITGPDAAFFSLDSTEGFDLMPGMQRALNVELGMNAPRRVLGAELVMVSNDPLQPLLRIPLSGERQLAPDVTVSSGQVVLQLLQGQTGSASFTLKNRGAGPLQWMAAWEGGGAGPDWVMLPGVSGTMMPKVQSVMKLNFDTGVLPPGERSRTLIISTNDVDTPELRIPVTLRVMATPRPVFSKVTMVEETQVGERRQFEVEIQNAGAASLVLNSMLFYSTAYRCTTRLPLVVPGGGVASLSFEFQPRRAGFHVAQAMFIGNLSSRFIQLTFSGLGYVGPRMKVSPASFSLSGAPGLVHNRVLKISNAGDKPLGWGCHVMEGSEWLAVTGEMNDLQGGQTASMNLRVDTATFAAGTRTGRVVVQDLSNGSETVVPVRVTVGRGPALRLEPAAMHLPSVWAGRIEDLSFACMNSGNQALEIRSITPAGNARLALSPDVRLPFLLEPGEQVEVPFTYATSTPGTYKDAFKVVTNAASARSVTLPITAQVSVPPAIAITPTGVDVTVEPGGGTSVPVTISNPGGSTLEWNASVISGVGPAAGLAGVLSGLQANPVLLSSLLPGAHPLSEGTTGQVINDGGANMFDGGNLVSTDLNSGLPVSYSDGVVTGDPAFGASSTYFTLKSGALWVLAADLNGVARLVISGGLGADGLGKVSGGSTTRTVAGVTYRGFYKKVYAAGVPSVNHLVIVEDRPGIGHRFDDSTDSDFHEVSGLSGSARIYYLMFGLKNGVAYADSAFGLLMDTFLRHVVHPADAGWLEASAHFGKVPAGGSSAGFFKIETSTLPGGTYGATVRYSNNSPSRSIVDVPVLLRIPSYARLEVKPQRFDFPDTFLAKSSTLAGTLENRGNEPLVISSLSVTDAAFAIPGTSAPFTLPPGGSRDITLRFSPVTVKAQGAELVIASNAQEGAEIRLPVNGRGLRGPSLTFDASPIVRTVEPGVSETMTLTLGNAGDASLLWSATPSASLASLVGVVPGNGTIPESGSRQVSLFMGASATTTPAVYTGTVRFSSNDPARPGVDLPVEIAVASRPRPVLAPSTLSFGSVMVGSSVNASVLLRNAGNATLTVTGMTSTQPAFDLPGTSFPFSLAPNSTRTLGVRFEPGEAAAFNGQVRFAMAGPALPTEVVLSVDGNGVPPPVLTVQPSGGVEVVLKKGQTAARPLTIRNDGGSTLVWQGGVVDLSTPAGTLQEVLERVNQKHDQITSLIPGLYRFTEGESGSYIVDGGDDMYDGGNYLSTNLGSTIAYSNNMVTVSSKLGAAGGAYFTRKQEGLFVFAADMAGVSSFTISGGLGADGSGSATGAVLNRTHDGLNYTGFFKAVSGTVDPSVNHLVIVESRSGQSHSYSTNTDEDNHTVTGLSSNSRLYYLLFATADGAQVSTELAGTVMDAFLQHIAIPPSVPWVSLSPGSGSVVAGASSTVSVQLASAALRPGIHTATLRFSGNAPGSLPVDLPLRLEVSEPDLAVAPSGLNLVRMQGADAAEGVITLTAKAGLQPSWSAAASASWMTLSKSSGTGGDTLGVRAGAGLGVGVYSGAVNITSDGVTVSVPVLLTVRFSGYTQLLTDYRQPQRVLGVVRGTGGQPSMLVPIDAATAAQGSPLLLPSEVTDADLTADGSRLYAVSFTERSITEVDMDSFTVTRTRSLPATLDSGSGGDFHYDVEAGRPGVVYYTDAAVNPLLHVFDFEAGEDLSTFLTNSGAGIGDFTVSPDGNIIFARTQSGWSGTNSVALVRLYSSGSFLTQTHLSSPYNMDMPGRSEVFFSLNRDVVFNRNRRYNPLLTDTQAFGAVSTLVAASAYGHVLVHDSGLVEGAAGTSIASLPAGVTAAAFTAGQDAVIYQHPTQNSLRRLSLAGIVSLPVPGIRPQLADGSTQATAPTALGWTGSPDAVTYDVYLGGSLETVTNAVKTSSGIYRGSTSGVSLSLPQGTFQLGLTYYWRIDSRLYDGSVRTGAVWSFRLPVVEPTPASLSVSGFPGSTAQEASLGIATADASTSWTLEESSSWLSLTQASGTGPGNVIVKFTAGSLPTGTYTASITLRSGSDVRLIPATFRVLGVLNVAKMIADPGLPFVYALHVDRAAPNEGHLLWIDPVTARVVHVYSVGQPVQDFAMHILDDRLYVLTASGTRVLGIQRQQNRQLVSTWDTPNTSAAIHNGPVGRVVLRGADHVLRLHHSVTGGAVGTPLNLGQCITATPADGSSILALVRQGSSVSGLARYNISTSSMTYAATQFWTGTYNNHLVLSGDGSRVFSMGVAYNASNLAQVADLGVSNVVRASSWNGQVIWTDTQCLQVSTGTILGPLPASSTVVVATPDYARLLIYNSVTNTLVSVTPP